MERDVGINCPMHNTGIVRPNGQVILVPTKNTERVREMVGATGFEPATPCSQSRCATKLRYAPTEKEKLQEEGSV